MISPRFGSRAPMGTTTSHKNNAEALRLSGTVVSSRKPKTAFRIARPRSANADRPTINGSQPIPYIKPPVDTTKAAKPCMDRPTGNNADNTEEAPHDRYRGVASGHKLFPAPPVKLDISRNLSGRYRRNESTFRRKTVPVSTFLSLGFQFCCPEPDNRVEIKKYFSPQRYKLHPQEEACTFAKHG